jgi:hypothetical protein
MKKQADLQKLNRPQAIVRLLRQKFPIESKLGWGDRAESHLLAETSSSISRDRAANRERPSKNIDPSTGETA